MRNFPDCSKKRIMLTDGTQGYVQDIDVLFAPNISRVALNLDYCDKISLVLALSFKPRGDLSGLYAFSANAQVRLCGRFLETGGGIAHSGLWFPEGDGGRGGGKRGGCAIYGSVVRISLCRVYRNFRYSLRTIHARWRGSRMRTLSCK